MEALSLLPVSIPSLHKHLQFPSKTHFSTLVLSPKRPLTNISSTHFFPQSTLLRSTPKDSNNESIFLDEDGVVDDMDGYLNYLSLEYDSVWDTKPSWCQPWTISLTGVMVIACSWALLRSALVTIIVSSLICAWWYVFLYAYPKAYSDMIAERREKVTSGMEDTFGLTKSQNS